MCWWIQSNTPSLVADIKPKLKNHYRAHRLSFWLNLVPDLHRTGTDDVPYSHHQLVDDDLDRKHTGPTVKPLNPPQTKNHGNNGSNYSVYTTQMFSLLNLSSNSNKSNQQQRSSGSADDHETNELLGNDQNTGSDDGFAAYSTALSVTIAIGCSLLILNVSPFRILRDLWPLTESTTFLCANDSSPYNFDFIIDWGHSHNSQISFSIRPDSDNSHLVVFFASDRCSSLPVFTINVIRRDWMNHGMAAPAKWAITAPWTVSWKNVTKTVKCRTIFAANWKPWPSTRKTTRQPYSATIIHCSIIKCRHPNSPTFRNAPHRRPSTWKRWSVTATWAQRPAQIKWCRRMRCNWLVPIALGHCRSQKVVWKIAIRERIAMRRAIRTMRRTKWDSVMGKIKWTNCVCDASWLSMNVMDVYTTIRFSKFSILFTFDAHPDFRFSVFCFLVGLCFVLFEFSVFRSRRIVSAYKLRSIDEFATQRDVTPCVDTWDTFTRSH